MKKPNAKSILKYLLLLIIAAVFLYLAFRNLSWNDFVTGLQSCNWWWIVGTMLIQTVITIIRGVRWRVMMKPVSKGLTRRECYDAYAVCYLANIGVPRSGEVVRCGLLAETKKISFEASLGTVVIERTWDMICMIICCIPLFFFGTFRDFLVSKLFRPAAESMNVGWVWIVPAIAAFIAISVIIVRRYRERISGNRLGKKILGFFRGLADGVKSCFKMEHKWLFFGYSALIWVGYWLCCLWTMYAFPATESMNGMDALLLMTVGGLGWIVPVPGGFGPYHFIVAETLIPIYGFSKQTGLIFATISHESQIVQMLVCGILSLSSWAIYRKHLKNK